MKTDRRPTLVLDESQWLYPVNVSKNTEPTRLNWIRRAIVDAGIACAFIATPQSDRDVQKRLVRATGYCLEQWEKRLLKTVELPNEIPQEDLPAIARVRLPNVPAKWLKYVVAAASIPERCYTVDVDNIAVHARILASEAGRQEITFEDIENGVREVVPQIAIPPRRREALPTPSRQPATPLPNRCTTPDVDVSEPFDAPARGTDIAALAQSQ